MVCNKSFVVDWVQVEDVEGEVYDGKRDSLFMYTPINTIGKLTSRFIHDKSMSSSVLVSS